MVPDDRDRSFEKALARHLRSSASSGLNAKPPIGVSGEACPDPETLAAYHDASLSADERNFWKQHVVGCDSCQLVLAHLETLLDIPVNLETNESVLARKQPASSDRSVSPARTARPSPPHHLRWLWLVPVGAIAAGLIAFVSLREPKPVNVAPGSPVEVAENRQLPAAAPSPQSVPAVPRERNEKDQRADQSAGGTVGGVSPNRDSAAKELHNQVQLTQQAPSQYAAKPAHGPSLSMQKQEQQIGRVAAGTAGAFDQKKLDAQAAPKLPDNGRQAAAPQAPPPPPPSQPSFIAGGTVAAPFEDKTPPPAPAPASSLAVSKAKAANADAISAMSESVEVSAEPQTRAQSHAMMRAAALQDPHVFLAPGGKQLWRLGPAGSLEHSSDKGVKWTLQVSGVDTDLQAGSAPSAKVCWVVGSSGTILRTTDGGAHWLKLDSPVTNDLTGVRATDAMHAWIWFVPDQQTRLIKTYQTSDGGSTWFSVPSE